MEAREIAEMLKDGIQEAAFAVGPGVNTDWGFGDADFFLEIDDEGRFLVTVAKVSE